MFTLVTALRSPHQNEHMQAAFDGLKALGIESRITHSSQYITTKHVACWGWRTGKLLRDRGHEVLVFERGYVGDRFKYSSIMWNGLNGFGEAPDYPDDGGERFRKHGGTIKPWKRDGQYAVIMGQVPGDMSLRGRDLMSFYKEKAREISEHYNIPVVFRPHPDLERRGIKQHIPGTLRSAGTLESDLHDAKFTVCFNSNSAVDSILSGVPCVVEDEGSMAWDVGSHSIYALRYPDREAWAHQLAWKQWEIDEIRTGEALRGILCMNGLL